MRRGTATAIAALWMATVAPAQEAGDGLRADPDPGSAVVVIDWDALFLRSRFGQRALAEIDAAFAELERENRAIEAELEAEERTLTERRPETDPETFRALAEAFDVRVEAIREEQDAKTRALQQRGDRERAAFEGQVRPILAVIAEEAGAAVVLDRRLVIAVTDEADVTDTALARIDAALGDGPPPDAPPARPAP